MLSLSAFKKDTLVFVFFCILEISQHLLRPQQQQILLSSWTPSCVNMHPHVHCRRPRPTGPLNIPLLSRCRAVQHERDDSGGQSNLVQGQSGSPGLV